MFYVKLVLQTSRVGQIFVQILDKNASTTSIALFHDMQLYSNLSDGSRYIAGGVHYFISLYHVSHLRCDEV